jgi:hypothetical protein
VKDRSGELNGLKIGVGNVKDRPKGIDGLKNWSGKCKGPAEGARRVKESK